MSMWKILLAFTILLLLESVPVQTWRRRRRRRRSPPPCDTTPCAWAWASCSEPCGPGTQSPVVTTKQGACGSCSLPGAQSCNLKPCPVNCAWSSYRSWSSCSVTCGGGTRVRSRVHSPPAADGGAACSGSDKETSSCNGGCCPEPCRWNAWAAYGSCSVACGGGTQKRTRTVAAPERCGGTACSGSSSQSRGCNTQCCRRDCGWDNWGSFGSCSASCAGGIHSRTRSVAVTATCGGSACTGGSTDTSACNTQCCVRDCSWNDWSAYGDCPVVCGGGKQSRTRSIAVAAACGGLTCSGTSAMSRSCNTQCCRRDCRWNNWSNYGSCSDICGGGTQTRSRSVAVTASCSGSACIGSETDSTVCNSQCCPVNCKWNNWSNYNSCSASCGGGTQIRTRSVAVVTSCGGSTCTGTASDSRTCNSQCCPVNCRWNNWSAFDTCSVSCGGGTKTRSRSVAVAEGCGGSTCEGESTDTATCNSKCCPVNCRWNTWGDFGSCSVSCGGGTQSRSRSVAIAAGCGGAECAGEASDPRGCNSHCCPVNCIWDNWTEFGACSVSCGSGFKVRTRIIQTDSHCGGNPCDGDSSQQAVCNSQHCPVNCVWGEWTDWEQCSKPCGTGSQSRSRKISIPVQYGALDCTGVSQQSRDCNAQCCKVQCEWENWSTWQSCSKSCGGGLRKRHRGISVQASCNGDVCGGEDEEAEDCNKLCCVVWQK